jgi:hypothetical protein
VKIRENVAASFRGAGRSFPVRAEPSGQTALSGALLRWSFANQKLVRSDVVSFGIPAFQAADGFATCPGAAACATFCFARAGWYATGRVQRPREHNLAAIRAGLTSFLRDATTDLDRIRASVVRVHDSGDFFSQAYFDAWCALARRFPAKTFYAYTKSLHLELWAGKPENFVVIQSEGGRWDARLRSDRPQARVFESEEECRRAGYALTKESDANAIAGVLRIGLVYHGALKLSAPQARALR